MIALYVLGLATLGGMDYANALGALHTPQPWGAIYWAIIAWANWYVGWRVLRARGRGPTLFHDAKARNAWRDLPAHHAPTRWQR